MKMINISNKKFDLLNQMELSKNTCNTEGQMYYMKCKNKEKILKRLYYDEGVFYAKNYIH